MKKLPEFDVIIRYVKRLKPRICKTHTVHRVYSMSCLLYTSAYREPACRNSSVRNVPKTVRSQPDDEVVFSSFHILFLSVTSSSRHDNVKNSFPKRDISIIGAHQNPYCVVLRRPRRVFFFAHILLLF